MAPTDFRRGLTTATLAVWALFSAAPSQAIVAGENGPIVFESGRTGNSDIFTMNPDGSNPVNLTNNPASDVFPAWSPDATKSRSAATAPRTATRTSM